ncbi:MAG: alpha/beta hydrolase [Thermoplasmata archaeon]|nr:alpha/beta hydrolase [Thermoplasmata archaeon]
MASEEAGPGLERGSGWPVVEKGRGRPVVFLHGYPLNHAMWEPQLKALSTDHRVILFDLPGFGVAQDWPVPNSLSGFVRIVYRTLAPHLGTPAVFVGHSFGGYLALALFEKHPELFAALVLTDTRSEADSVEARTKRLATARRLENPAEHLDAEELTRSLLAPATWEAAGPVVGKVRQVVREATSAAVIGSLRAIAYRGDLTPVLATVRVPTLVLWGTEDKLIPPSQSQAMLEHLPNAIGAGVPGAGHLPSLENPQAFSRAIRELLDRLPAYEAPATPPP